MKITPSSRLKLSGKTIELLMPIAIVAFLAGFFLPILAKLREHGISLPIALLILMTPFTIACVISVMRKRSR